MSHGDLFSTQPPKTTILKKREGGLKPDLDGHPLTTPLVPSTLAPRPTEVDLRFPLPGLLCLCVIYGKVLLLRWEPYETAFSKFFFLKP